ncbi:hypothetical protein HYPSUDRAFT_49121 [Hypholoma sublateritium FD-334 SS-4]|uniref:TPR-like protein n=1 Tax=Hypholoma sublateritium (strain FD-334 SS-4) TaxID=945553 RepID=A0A0D2LUH0_HYPSF|nr:hypothetical protein HYPSUDRAFT_49121 [Hypholoma sublateritium FD-334 SS-4]
MPPKACDPNSNAERLKAQGNELHQKRQYREAYLKYTAAIGEDSTNAIYYANRAASALSLKEYLNAAADAKKATELDPKYAKAWSRLGQAYYGISAWSRSVDALETALECLPPQEHSTEAEKQMRIAFAESLTKSQKEVDTPVSPERMTYVMKDQKLPWEKAAALEKELLGSNKASSGLVILEAYREFKDGVETMKKLQKKAINGTMGYEGTTGALVSISNAVMRDPRVFHIDCSDWEQKYNDQVLFEVHYYKAWSRGGPQVVKEEALKRLAQEGWASLRPALSITVRAWLMCGMMYNSFGKHQAAVEYYTRAVEVLDWGQLMWRDVPAIDRGVIFEKTFIRGAKRMQLSAMHNCLVNKMQDLPFDTSDMVKLCHDIIADIVANPPPSGQITATTLASFWMYPQSEAFSILGWHYMQLGHAMVGAEDAQEAFSQSAEHYIKAAESSPPDDESVLIFYMAALEAHWYSPQGKSVKTMQAIINRMTLPLRDILRFWENSVSSKQRDATVQTAFEFGQRCRDRKLSDGDSARPKELEKLCKWGGNFVYV